MRKIKEECVKRRKDGNQRLYRYILNSVLDHGNDVGLNKLTLCRFAAVSDERNERRSASRSVPFK